MPEFVPQLPGDSCQDPSKFKNRYPTAVLTHATGDALLDCAPHYAEGRRTVTRFTQFVTIIHTHDIVCICRS